MNLKLSKKEIRLNLSLPVCFLLLLLASLALEAAMFFIQINGWLEVLKCVSESRGLLLLLNFLPIFLPMLFLFFVSGNLVFSAGTVGVVVMVLSVANRFKMAYRFAPLMPWDFMLGGEVLGIAKSFGPKMLFAVVFGLLLVIIAWVVVFLVVKHKPLPLTWRVVGGLVLLCSMALVNNTLLSNRAINRELLVIGNVLNPLNQFNAKGFVYQFIYTWNTEKITKPQGYDEQRIEAVMAEYAPADDTDANQKSPHLFLILGEAFTEMPLSPVLSFQGYDDPLRNYKTIKAESAAGNLIVANVGGGTADTEFDMLTGINVRQFRRVPYGNLLITKPQNAMPRVLSELGYSTHATHLGYPWFYNRQNVFPYLGFDQFTSVSDIDNLVEKGMYAREDLTYDRVMEDFNTHVAQNPNNPLFSFVITIQNHGPYPDKYGTDVAQNFNSTVNFSPEDVNALSNYFLGMVDMDRELGRFIDAFRESPEPVVVAYFGDHLPLLSQDVYDALLPKDGEGVLAKDLAMNRTPYFVWANDAAKAVVGDSAEMLQNQEMSAFYFGAALLDYLGYNEAEPFFTYINKMRREAPVVLENTFITPDGISHEKNGPAGEGGQAVETINLYEQWAYYRLYH